MCVIVSSYEVNPFQGREKAEQLLRVIGQWEQTIHFDETDHYPYYALRGTCKDITGC